MRLPLRTAEGSRTETPIGRPLSTLQETVSYKHRAGGWIGLNLAVGQRPPGLVQMRGDSPGGPVSGRAAQVAVCTQRLSGTVAYLGTENRLNLNTWTTVGAENRQARSCSNRCELAVPYHCTGLRVLAAAPHQDGRLRARDRLRVTFLQTRMKIRTFL